jgi:hypothetical protein
MLLDTGGVAAISLGLSAAIPQESDNIPLDPGRGRSQYLVRR